MTVGAAHVRVVEGIPRHRDYRLDGGNALSAAALRLSLRGRARLQAVGNLQGHGAAAAQRDHHAGDGSELALGLWLAWTGGSYVAGWLQAKVVLVVGLSALHGVFARCVRDFAADRNRHSQKFYRIINEVPTILMIGIVILAVVKPF